MKRNIMWCVTVTIFAMLYYVNTLQIDDNEIITIRLTTADGNDESQDVVVGVPAKFIGPDMLSLAQKAKKGGRFKTLPLAYTYPDFQPWPKNWRELERQNKIDLVMSFIGSGKFGSTRRFMEAITHGLKYKGERYGLRAYARTLPMNMGGGLAGKEFQTVYHFRDEHDPAKDVGIICPVEGERGKCRYDANSVDGRNIYINFATPPEKLQHWQSNVEALRAFVSQFQYNDVKK
jgi:hypothetical protein